MSRIRWNIARLLIRAGWKLAGIHVSPGQIHDAKFGTLTL